MDRREELKRQLMVTFQAELEDHLGTLNGGLLALEEGPSQEEWEPLLANLFRAAHSLKGAARAVDLQDIETIAHRLEDVLGAIQRGELCPELCGEPFDGVYPEPRPERSRRESRGAQDMFAEPLARPEQGRRAEGLSSTPELFDALFPAIDAMREAMAAHLRGESLPAEQRDQLLARLEAAKEGRLVRRPTSDVQREREEVSGPETEAREPEGEVTISEVVERVVEPRPEFTEGQRPDSIEGTKPPVMEVERLRTLQPSSGQALRPGSGQALDYGLRTTEETIRVATAKLDALMDGMGELLVARMRTEQRLAELRTLQQQLTRWQKCWRQVRTHYNRLQQQNGSFDSSTSPPTSRWAESIEASEQALRHGSGQATGLSLGVSPAERSSKPQDVAPLLDFLTHNEEHIRALSAGIDGLLRRFASDYSRLTLLTGDLQDGVRHMRMLPIATLFDLFFPRMVRDLARERGKEVTLRVVGADTEVDRQVLEAMKDPLTHLLRNAMDHGIEPPGYREAVGKPRRGTVHLRAAQKGNTIVLEVADDGAGIDLQTVQRAAVERGLLTAQEVAGLSDQETMQLIFRSGLSTLPEVTSLSGRGVGLDVVRENLEGLHGLIEVDTALGQGTIFTMTLPLTLTTSRVLLVEVAGQMVAVPAMTVERILRVEAASVGRIEGRPAIRADGRPLPLLSLAQVLELPEVEAPLAPGQRIPVVVLGVVEKRIAFRVDGFRGTQEVVIKNLGPQLSRVRNVAGATILGTGQVVMILNVADLMKTAQVGPAMAAPLPVEVREARRRRVLVVDDSITTPTLEKNILESASYEVLVAADGEEAWALVQSEPLDAIAADIAMPRMDGFVLTEKVKSDERFKELPVVLVTSLESPQDKIRGLEAGADAYITKSTFDQLELLETIERLIG